VKITTDNQTSVDNVFDQANEEGRSILFEHEVYQILNGIGLDIPKYHFLKVSEEVTADILSSFGDEVIVKIVSSDIAHKQKVGGVKKVKNYEPLFVQFVLEKMKEEVLSHYSEENKPQINGFLIVELVDFKQSIGYEILLGVKDDPSFGPVVTLSKGGDDAEFFAKYYDKANLLLPQLSYEEAQNITNKLNIKHKFKSIGHEEYLDFIAKAASVISSLAHHYSYIHGERPKYFIKTMDINPFVITKDNRFIAVDGYIEFEKAADSKKYLPHVNTLNIKSFFNPKGIAVIGVSSDPTKYSMGREIARLLHDLRRDDLYCVNMRGGEAVLGNQTYTLYESIEDIPADIEMVVYAAPAKHITSFFANLKGKGPKSVVLIPGISQDIDYNSFTEELNKVIPTDVRIIGPNCMGVFYGEDEHQLGVNTLFIDEERLHLAVSEHSNTALLTQSGGMAITLIDKMPNAPIFKSIVSFGNKYDVKITDLIKYFNEDAQIKVIALYIEGFAPGEGRVFYDLMKEVHKPVIVYKSGRTDVGAKAAASHTAAMTGDYDVFEAACKQAKVLLIDDTEAYHDSVKAFALLANKKVTGNKVAGVLNAGFEATVASDELGILEPAIFSKATQERIDSINKLGLVNTSMSILDVTPMTDDILFKDFIEAALQDDAVDCVFVGIVPHVENIKATPNTCNDENSLANLIVRLTKKYDKPLVVSVNGGEYYGDFVDIMEKAGIPVYADVRAAVKSLERFVKYHLQT
jgi:acyl-CoA synthetase (NDP forming)